MFLVPAHTNAPTKVNAGFFVYQNPFPAVLDLVDLNSGGFTFFYKSDPSLRKTSILLGGDIQTD